MKRRDFVKMLGWAAISPLALYQETAVANSSNRSAMSSEVGDNIYDYFLDVPSLNADLARLYFPSNYDASIQYDVIVIGSGMGGGILADATSDAGLKTLVLEAGALRHFMHVSNLPIDGRLEILAPYRLVNDSIPYNGVSFCLGGKSIFWSNVIPRMEAWELRYWPDAIANYLASDGYDKSEALFRKKSQFLDHQNILRESIENKFADFSVSHLPRAYHTPTLASRKGFPDEKSTGFFSTAALLTSSMSTSGPAGSGNLTINLNQIVSHIETKGKRASAVHCYDPIEKKTRVFNGKSIVLCAGTLESARISISSKLKDKSNKIGVGATYHQSAEMQFTVPDSFSLLSRYDLAQLYLRPKDNKNRDRFTCELALNWQFWDAKTEDDDIWNQKYSQPGPSRSTIKFLFRRPLNDKNYIRVNGNSCEVYIEPMNGEPLRDEVYKLKERVMKYFGASESDINGEITYQQVGDASWHIAGSLRSGEPGHSVLNTDLRFHEYENLYVCDLSVFPDIPAVNPSLTLGALALRLAKHLSG